MKINPANLDPRGAHDLLAGAVLPRPIALVATIGEKEVYNLAPFSFFIPMAVRPAIVGIGIGRRRDGSKKDTLVNIELNKDLVINLVTEDLAEAMNQAAGEYPPDVDEFKIAGLTPRRADFVKAPLVAESPVSVECRLLQILEYGQFPRINNFVIAEAIQFHVKDEFLAKGEIQSSKLKAIGRMGGDLYCRTTDIFEMKRVVVADEKQEG